MDSSRRPLLDLFPYSALFGSTVDTCLSVYGGVGLAGCDAPRAVPSWFSGPNALHHGRYGPAGAVYGAVQKTAEIPQLQFIMVVAHPHGPSDHRDTPVAFLTRFQVVAFPVAGILWEMTSCFLRIQR